MRVNLTNRYRVVALSIVAIFFSVGSLSTGWATSSTKRTVTSFGRSAARKTPTSPASPLSICLNPKPAMASCTVTIYGDEIVQNHMLSQGMDWTFNPELPCMQNDCSVDFIIADEVNSGHLTVTQDPSNTNNALGLNASGASLGSHTLSVSWEADDDNGYESGGCNELSINVSSTQSAKAMKKGAYAMTKAWRSTLQK